MKILVVDPSPPERELTLRALSSARHQVNAVGKVAEATGALQRSRHDVVVVECTTPEARDFVAELRTREGAAFHTWVIATASRASDNDMRRAFGAGVDDFVRKPINAEELLLRIDRGARAQMLWQKILGRPLSVDLISVDGFLTSHSWKGFPALACDSVGGTIGMDLTPVAHPNPLAGAVLGAQLPLTMISENLELHIAVAVDAASGRALATSVLGNEDAGERDIVDMLRELANMAAGALKRAAEEEGRVLTMGLPEDRPPGTFVFDRAKVARGFTAACGDTGATLRFLAQYIAVENRHVPVNLLRAGMVLAQDILNPAGALLVRGGTRVNEAHMNQLPRSLGETALVAVMAAAA